jgi:4,5-DOPA dioxygenase extradiol
MEKIVFVGHGSPMNALEGNKFAKAWQDIGIKCGPVEAILCVSAHWYTTGSQVAVTPQPRTIHDFYGFPEELYEIAYRVPGAPEIARRAARLLPTTVSENDQWGLDHGSWSVLRHMYPQEAGIPVFQLSIDRNASPATQMAYGKALSALRSQGVLIVGSGNIVHNLGMVSFDRYDGFPWAYRFDAFIHDAIIKGDFAAVADSLETHQDANLAVPTREHFDPLLYVLGAVKPGEPVTTYNRECVMGSISMNAYVFG